MKALDRLLTIIVTVTLTSAFWIVAGGSLLERAGSFGWGGTMGGQPPGEAAPATSPSPAAAERSIDLAAAASSDRALIVPVAGIEPGQLSDTYSQSRGGGARLHEAIDIMAPRGTPVVAAAGGTVEKLFRSVPGGLTVYIRSPDRKTIHYYAHLDSYDPGLAEAMVVRQGQRIGTVGSTGNANPDGPHLHFAVMRIKPEAKWWEPATAINPYPLLRGS